MKRIFLLFLFILAVVPVMAQLVRWNPEDITLLTKQWKGERSPDGRPKVSDAHLERLKKVGLEEVWEFLKSKGYENQFENFSGIYENEWRILHPEQVMTGRVVTAQFMPMRFDFDDYLQEVGKKQDIRRVSNGLPVSALSEGDVYVADAYGKIADGTLMGGSVGGSVYNRSKRGVIINGSVRDLEELLAIDGFNGWIRGHDPSSISHMVCESVNAPIRIGRVTVLPGDVVLAKVGGVIFIPPHLAVESILYVEVAALRNEFNRQRREGKIDNEADFREWLNRYPNLPMPKAELDAYLSQQASQQNQPVQPARSQRQ
jgi:regulator of RNase E activity RraA